MVLRAKGDYLYLSLLSQVRCCLLHWLRLLVISKLVNNFDVLPSHVRYPCVAGTGLAERLERKRKDINFHARQRHVVCKHLATLQSQNQHTKPKSPKPWYFEHPSPPLSTQLIPLPSPVQSRDSSFTYIHLHSSHHADLIEETSRHSSRTIIASESISVRPQDLPTNPEDEDDVVPDQHAAFGIQRATQTAREPGWRDLGLGALMEGSTRIGAGGGLGGRGGLR